MRQTIGVALLVGLAAAAGAAERPWVEVRSARVHLVGDASPREAERTAAMLERFHDAVGARLARPVPPAPTTVVLFRGRKSFRPFQPAGGRTAIGGIFLRGPDRNYVALDVEADAHAYQIVLHEYAHVLLSPGGQGLPLWLNEGLAEYFGAAEVDERRVRLGRLLRAHVFRLHRTPLLPLPTLFRADERSPLYSEQDKTGLFYAQSWALVHYLLLGREPRGDLWRYADAIAGGRSPEQACLDAFGVGPAELQKELAAYLRQYRFRTEDVAVPGPAAVSRAASLPPAPAEAYKGDLLVHWSRAAEGRPYLERAMAMDPALALPYRSLALAAYQAGHRREALGWLAGAIERDGRDGYTRFLRAQATLEEARVVGPAAAALVHEDLRLAVALAPGLVPARRLLQQVERILGIPGSRGDGR